jgi:hypothetical protein
MSTSDPLDRRAIASRRVVGVVAVIGTIAVLVAIIVWLIVRWAFPPGFLTDQQFGALRLGQTRSDIEHAVGQPQEDSKAVQPSRLPSGTTCTYYEANGWSNLPSYFRLCYTNNVLSSKIEYSSPYGQPDQPSLTPSPS